MVNINIKLSNKTLYLLIGIVTVLVVAGVAIAVDPAVHGHVDMDPLYIVGSNVGIGTASPGAKLELAEGIAKLSFKVNQDISGLNPGSTTAGEIIEGTLGRHLLFDLIGNDDTDAIAFRTDSNKDGTVDTIAMVVKNTGNVGIGTTSPSAGLKLDVEGNVGATQYCDQNGLNCKTITQMGGGLTQTSCYWKMLGNGQVDDAGWDVGICNIGYYVAGAQFYKQGDRVDDEAIQIYCCLA